MARDEARLDRLVFRGLTGGILVGALLWVYAITGPAGLATLDQLGQFAAVSLLLLGKFVVFSGLHEDAPAPWVLAMLVWWIDLVLAALLAGSMQGIERAPLVGRWMRRMRRRAVRVLHEYPGLERTAFLGVVTFVLLPLAATGAVTGSLAARLLGLSRAAGVVAIAVGSGAIAGTFALLARFVGERAETIARSPLSALALLAILGVLGRAAYLRVLERLRQRPRP